MSRLGWFMFAAALIMGVGAILFGDDAETAEIFAAGALGFTVSGTLYIGAPFARAGRPSLLRIAALFGMAAGGLVLMVVVDWLVAIAVLYASYAIVVLSLARWPPPERAEPGVLERSARPPLGLPVAVLGTFFAFFVGAAVIAEVTDSRGVQAVLVMVLAVVWSVGVLQIRALYVGQLPARSAPTNRRRPGS